MKTTIPAAVSAWVDSHKGSRSPVHSPGMFSSYSETRASDCWGQPRGGISIPGFRVAVCQPSPRRVGETPVFLFDFIPA